MGYGFSASLKYYLRCVLDVLYGNCSNCVICNDYAEELLCKDCTGKLNYEFIEGRIEKEGTSIEYYSCAYYSSLIKEMVIRLKYKNDFNCGRILTELMGKLVIENCIDVDYITFVPSDKAALKKRGYNQSKFLSEMLSQTIKLPVADCLIKDKATRDQIGLDGEGRWNNLKHCFGVKKYDSIKGRKVLLVDDVITTGATAFYCAKALLEYGCGKVCVLTVAKSTI